MSGKETGWFRLEGGTIQEMDLPLHESIAQRVAKGEIKRVADADGGAWDEPETDLPVVTDVTDAEKLLGKALDRVDELEAELAEVTKQRDELAAAKAPAKTGAKAKATE